MSRFDQLQHKLLGIAFVRIKGVIMSLSGISASIRIEGVSLFSGRFLYGLLLILCTGMFGSGVGLHSMRECAVEVGGVCTIENRTENGKERGVVARLSLPVQIN